jgi:hypothetical protein
MMMKTFYGTYYIQQNGDSLWWLGKNTKKAERFILSYAIKRKTIQRIDSARNPAETDKDLQLMLAKGKQVISYTSQKNNKQQKQFKDIKKTS